MTKSKAEWRRELMAARSAMPDSKRRAASEAVASSVGTLSCMASARTLLTYMPIGAELDPQSIYLTVRTGELSVLVPARRAAADAPAWEAYPVAADHGAGPITCCTSLQFPVVAIVPGVGFDESGTRLGRGAGYYDRALARLRSAGPVHVVGIGFDAQIVERLPRDPWDQAVDIVVSEARIVRAAASRG